MVGQFLVALRLRGLVTKFFYNIPAMRRFVGTFGTFGMFVVFVHILFNCDA